jgi:neutral ceramidase
MLLILLVVLGLSNVYTHYISTFEEYQKQRYEAASTLYGPHTLEAYLQHYPILVESLLDVSFMTLFFANVQDHLLLKS